MELDRQKRPSIVDIIHKLDVTETMIEKVIESQNIIDTVFIITSAQMHEL
jgi:hypothetical protein